MLERCLYQRDVCIREMSVLEWCLYWRDVCILERCLYIREMSVVERCLYWRGVCIRKLSHKLSLITSRATVVLVWPVALACQLSSTLAQMLYSLTKT